MALAIAMTNPSLVSHCKPIPLANSEWSTIQSNFTLRSPLAVTGDRKQAVTPKTAFSKPDTKTRLVDTWQEIQGSDDWHCLLDPLHPLLRSEIIRYGEHISACYKSFDVDPQSNRYLNCKYGRRTMFDSIGMGESGYEVTKYVYATPDIAVPTIAVPTGRWIGYVAVSTDEYSESRLGRRDILVAFRGTVTTAEWIANFMSSLTPANLDPSDPRPDIKVESGFLSLYTCSDSTRKFSQGSCREQLLNELSRIVNKYKSEEEVSITLAGHSMGSSLALLLGYDLAELGLNRVPGRRKIPITVHSFGGPRVGNSAFKKRCEELGVKVLRVVNVNDPVTKIPGVFLNEKVRGFGGKYEMPWSCSCYAHVGVELAVSFFERDNPGRVHDLEAYIGLLKCSKATTRVGKRGGADLVTKAKELTSRRRLVALPWQDAAMQVGNLVQSLGF